MFSDCQKKRFSTHLEVENPKMEINWHDDSKTTYQVPRFFFFKFSQFKQTFSSVSAPPMLKARQGKTLAKHIDQNETLTCEDEKKRCENWHKDQIFSESFQINV